MLIQDRIHSAVFTPHSAFRIPHSREFRIPRSQGFTLVELLVAIAIIILLMSLVLAFYPKREVRYAAQGADQLQTYIAAAKSRALRDQAPRGIRFIQSPSGDFRQFEYVEVPEPYMPGTNLVVPLNGNVNAQPTVNLAGDHRTSIFAGDMLEITHGTGSIHRIRAVNANLVGGNTQLQLMSSPPAATNASLNLTSNYRFIRQPRPLMGETPLVLPDKVFVQPGGGAWPNSLNLPFNSFTNSFEIIFSPSGQVINAGAGRIVLVVMDENNVSKPTLLCVYSYTGAVGAHPEGPAGNPYAFTQDGRSSGQ